MTEHTHHTELIDSYLSGGMSAAEETSFMDLMETDPILKEEFLFQKSIVGGLREYRKNELKNRLSSISVGIGIVGFLMNAGSYKLMAAVLSFGIIGYGTYYGISEYANKQKDLSQLYNPVSDPDLMNADHPQSAVIAYLTDEEVREIIAFSDTRYDQNEVPAAATAKTSKAIATKSDIIQTEVSFDRNESETKETIKRSVIIPDFTVPDFSEEPYEEEPSGNTLDVSNLESLGFAESEEEKKIEIEQVRKNNKTIQYKFEEGKLYLYGDFGGVPYELLEINSSGKKRLYFYHNKQYYRLNRFQKSVSNFEKINDKKLVKELEILRSSR